MACRRIAQILTGIVAPLACIGVAHEAAAQSARALDVRAAKVIEHWTPDRRAAATPRDLFIDPRGLAYISGPGNSLVPHGHSVAFEHGNGASPNAAPGGDSTPPSVSNMNPASGATVTSGNYNFSATITDASGLRSVSMSIRQGTGAAQSFAMSQGANGQWSVSLSGLTNGSWSWSITAKDAAKGGGNTTNTGYVPFTVAIGSGGGGGGAGSVSNAPYTFGGVAQNAVGRIYFEMPDNARLTRWAGYVCSGTVASDGTTGRTVIITAAHCVYDDANKAFARNVLFIPDQDGTTGAGTDTNCSNDPLGCWVPSIGVVDTNWTTRTFPDNVAWDYAFYVVPDSGAHQGTAAPSQLDAAVTPMTVSFSAPALGTLTHGLGYSYSDDPNFMYCADSLSQESAVNWWLGNCGLSGGSSGGPWSQGFSTSTGNGSIHSVNSWGYTGQLGMAGPKLSGTSASCVFAVAKSAAMGTFADGQAGVKANCP